MADRQAECGMASRGNSGRWNRGARISTVGMGRPMAPAIHRGGLFCQSSGKRVSARRWGQEFRG